MPRVSWDNDEANTRHSPNVVLMLGQRRRRWPNIETAWGECLMFAGVQALKKTLNKCWVNVGPAS